MEMRDTFDCPDKATLYSFGETCRPWQIPVKMPEEFALDVNGACITETLQSNITVKTRGFGTGIVTRLYLLPCSRSLSCCLEIGILHIASLHSRFVDY